MQLTVRIATMDDMAAVDALLARSYPKLLKADYPPSVLVTALPLISRANPALLSSGSYYVAIAKAGQVVGAGGWTPDLRHQGLGHIRHVVSDDRCLRMGIGRALIDHTLRCATQAGLTMLECWSTLTAVPFYQTLGFTVVGPMDVPLRPGISFPSMRMTRAL